MKKDMLVSSIVAIFFSIILATTAFANSGPHGNYNPTTDACAGCHRAHTAPVASLLINTSPDLCFTCHGSGATGADTNVEDGIQTSSGQDLLGGGFTNFQGLPVSSTHSVDGSFQNAWGSGTTWTSTYDCAGCHNAESGLVWPGIPQWGISPGALSTFPGRGQNVTMPLTCTSCHDPHGGRNYRLLQQRLHPPSMQQYVTVSGDDLVLVTSNETGGYNPDQPGYVPNYVEPRYQLGLGDWCTGCHFTYQQVVSVQPFNAEDGKGRVTRYRHNMNTTLGALTTGLPLEQPTGYSGTQQATDQLFCLSCHYAHGTTVAAEGFAANVLPTNDSALLRLDNRGVCEECHKK